MALIQCPECGQQISDTAKCCVHCGFPIKEQPQSAEVKQAESKKLADLQTATTASNNTENQYRKAIIQEFKPLQENWKKRDKMAKTIFTLASLFTLFLFIINMCVFAFSSLHNELPSGGEDFVQLILDMLIASKYSFFAVLIVPIVNSIAVLIKDELQERELKAIDKNKVKYYLQFCEGECEPDFYEKIGAFARQMGDSGIKTKKYIMDIAIIAVSAVVDILMVVVFLGVYFGDTPMEKILIELFFKMLGLIILLYAVQISLGFVKMHDQKLLKEWLVNLRNEGIKQGGEQAFIEKCEFNQAELPVETLVQAETQKTVPAGKRQKNKVTALLLCIFLGHLGVHRFYEGKIGTGILYLFTFGLFWVGAIVDLIRLIRTPNPYYV